MKGFISRVQHYSTKDGPGIRTTVFMVGCNLRCRWCANPELISHKASLLYHKDRCQRCGSCVEAYPDAIRMGEEGCIIDRSRIIDYAELEDICSYDAYEKIGVEMESAELVSILLRDREFYEQSGGGVTFSGGEALLQKDFVLECTRLLHQEGIHVTLDTAGNVPYNEVEALIREADLILYDVKHSDSGIHREYTGVGNERILDNLRQINEAGKDVRVRMVVIPGLEDLKERVDFLKGLTCIRQIDFLPYHIMGVGKYERLGQTYTLKDLSAVDEELIEEAVKYAESLGFQATIGG